MSSLFGCFERDIVYLSQNLIPITNSGIDLSVLTLNH